jgi:hypothetical protein
MGGYWKKVLAAAWKDTKESFGWNQKTVATSLVAIAGVVVVFFHLGLLAMIANATGLLWAALPFVIAGFLLFAWDFISVPARLYAEQAAAITELEVALARAQEPPPDYIAWRHVDELSLRTAAFLWCGLEPRLSRPPKVTAWLNALIAAVKKGELEFVPSYSGNLSKEREREHQRSRPHTDTVVTRSALQAFAKKHSHDPIFLRDA